MSEKLNESKEQLLPPSEVFKKVLSYDELAEEAATEIKALAERGNISVDELAELEQTHGYRMPAFFYGTLLPGKTAGHKVEGGIDGAIRGELPAHSVVAMERTTETFGYEFFPAAYKDPESGEQIVNGYVFTFKETGPMIVSDNPVVIKDGVEYPERLQALCKYEEVSPDGVQPGLYTLEIAEIEITDDLGNKKTAPAIYYHATTELLEQRTQSDGEGKFDEYEPTVPIGLGDIATKNTVSDWLEYEDRTQKK